jgi:hypothetical protein
MKYFLYHEGKTYPEHITSCLRNILKTNSNNSITFCTNQNIQFNEKNIDVINLNDLDIPDINNFLRSDPNPLWYTSLNRIFYLNSFLQKTKIPVIHFDNDVLCYYDFKDIEEYYKNEIYLTPHKKTEYTFGFSYIGCYEKMQQLTTNIYNVVQHGETHARKCTGDHIHEMRLLNYCGQNLIKNLPVYPSGAVYESYLFDPSSYGQHLDGTPNGEQPGYLDKEHIVGSQITYTDTIFFDKKPYLKHNSKILPIFNLHVHSKNLKKYEIQYSNINA